MTREHEVTGTCLPTQTSEVRLTLTGTPLALPREAVTLSKAQS